MIQKREYSFTIPGEPQRAPRMTRSDRWARRPAVVKYFTWANHARRTLFKDDQVKINGENIEHIQVVFFLPIAKSTSLKKQAILEGSRHQTYPDIDNLFKAILDALVSQDKAVWSMGGMKLYCEKDELPKTIVTITLNRPLDNCLIRP